jgi:hypothetical protein
MTFKEKLHPFRTIKKLVQIVEMKSTIIEQLETLIGMQKDMNAAQGNCIAMQTATIKTLTAELNLLKMATGSTVDQITRDGIEPPEPKKYLN